MKEYRIPLPMSLEEYRIAQLYMIQKKSRLESTGSGSSVEIIENVPYENGPGGNGQYTKKIYHIGSHLPGWLKALLPKTALRVEEEAWNAYPYTKTRHTCPFIERFFIDIETHYLPDLGQTENVFNLSYSARKNCEIDLIDPVKDPFPQKDYKKEEDPCKFVSNKTGRGPLSDDWLDEYKSGNQKSPVMCAYKLIKVEFKYWGMQSKIENFIQNGLRNPMLVGHRQAWSWQDEWYGLTIEDIRQLEKQAQMELSKRMEFNSDEKSKSFVKHNQNNNSPNDSTLLAANDVSSLSTPNKTCNSNVDYDFSHMNSSISAVTNQERLLEIHMKHIEEIDSDDTGDDDNDDESFYDALDYFEENPMGENSGHMISTSTTKETNNDGKMSTESAVMSPTINTTSENHFTYNSQLQTLVFVIQGGAVSDCNIDSDSRLKDFQVFERLFTNTCNTFYPGARGSVFFEVIECMPLTKGIMRYLMDLNVESSKGPLKSEDSENLSNSFPFSAVPLLILHHPEFQMVVNGLVDLINSKYEQLQSLMDTNRHEVYFICDSIGGLLAFQALCQYLSRDDLSLSSSNEDEDPCSIDNSHSTLTFRFMINGVFALGSPIGMVALKKKLSPDKDFSQPRCGQIYNIFHSFDPVSSRVEPLIDGNFANVRPALVPRSHAFPFNNDIQYSTTIHFDDSNSCEDSEMVNNNTLKSHVLLDRKVSNSSVSSMARKSAYSDKSFFSNWWGTKRIDYMTYSPEGLQQFPLSTLIQLCYNSYWESKDIVTFILWQILQDSYSTHQASVQFPETIYLNNIQLQPKEKWRRRRTWVKIKNLNPNHRANDVCSMAGAQHFLTAKFAYGPVDMASLSGEKIDVYSARRPQLTEWKYLGTNITDSHGRFTYTLPSREIDTGVYNVKMVVRGDHTSVDCNMVVLPPKTEAVVFSIDGSFLASYSIRGVDPKIRGGAVDVVRYWQELGYFIIYVSSRLLFQKQQVMSWLGSHNFPFGLVSFCETVSTDYQKHKQEFLKNICKFEQVVIYAAYGSSRDVSLYSSILKLPPQKIFMLGKKPKSKKGDVAQWITDGYKTHLTELQQGTINTRHSLNKKSFWNLGYFGRVQTRKASRLKTLDSEKLEKKEKDKEKKSGIMKSIRSKSSKQN